MDPDVAVLQRALDKQEFRPSFQPQVELRTGQVTGFELLARWRKPTGEMISPDEFIPRIEAADLCDRLTETLLRQAFAAPAVQTGCFRISVNLSPVQIQNPGLPGILAECARPTNFSLSRLTLEITESALLNDLDRAKEVSAEVKRLGCRLALDDFGTGYSSLRHLEALPFDKIKVDGRYVRSMTEARSSRKIVAAVVGLGQSLGLITVGEGVETAAQADMLIWLGCDLGQGWLFGKPAPADEIPRILSTARPQASASVPLLGRGPQFSLESLPAQRLAQLQAIYDGAPVGLCFLDRKMRYVSINRRLAEMNGAPVAGHLGKTVAEVMPHLFPLVQPHIARALRGRAIAGVEVEKPATPGGRPPQTLLLCYQPARDEAGEVIGVSISVVDISEHKRTQMALSESMEHFRHMLNLGPNIPWVLNARGEVIEVSSRWQAVTGQPIVQAIGSGWLAMLHPDDVPPIRKAIQETLTEGFRLDASYRVCGADGAWHCIRTRGAPRFDCSGKIVAVYGVAEELTAHLETPAWPRDMTIE